MAATKIGVVIADDHPAILKWLSITLKKNFEIGLLKETTNGLDLIEAIEKTAPELAIIDLEMPKMNGYDAIQKIHTEHPHTKTIVFSGFLTPKAQEQAIINGAHSTISKTESSESIINAIETILKGERYHSNAFSDTGIKPPLENRKAILTLREKQILDLIAKGQTSKEISALFNISKATVDKHRSNIKEKLGLKNIAELVRYAINLS